MKRLAVVTLLIVVAAGCGGSKHAGPLQVTEVPSSPSCDQKGISTSAAQSGTCHVDTTKIRVAGKGRWLKMKDYDVRLSGVQTKERIGNHFASNFTPDGQFVIATLQARNTSAKPQRFDASSNLAYLLVDGTEYLEVPGAELGGSFAKDDAEIAPGQVATGTVVFDPPAAHAKNLDSAGSHIVFLDSDETGNGYPRLGFRSLGFIQLWK
jgi:hypothetical protein